MVGKDEVMVKSSGWGERFLALYSQITEEKEKIDIYDEMLCLIGFSVIGTDEEEARREIPKITPRVLRYLERYQDQKGIPPENLNWFSGLKSELSQDFLNKISNALCAEALEGFVPRMESHCLASCLNPFRSLIYSNTWERVYKEVVSEELVHPDKCKWFYKDNVLDYDSFFIAVMIGLFMMRNKEVKNA